MPGVGFLHKISLNPPLATLSRSHCQFVISKVKSCRGAFMIGFQTGIFRCVCPRRNNSCPGQHCERCAIEGIRFHSHRADVSGNDAQFHFGLAVVGQADGCQSLFLEMIIVRVAVTAKIERQEIIDLQRPIIESQIVSNVGFPWPRDFLSSCRLVSNCCFTVLTSALLSRSLALGGRKCRNGFARGRFGAWKLKGRRSDLVSLPTRRLRACTRSSLPGALRDVPSTCSSADCLPIPR